MRLAARMRSDKSAFEALEAFSFGTEWFPSLVPHI